MAEIHQSEFQDLCDYSDEIRQGSQSAGVLLTGGAGVGKSHLLSRICNWATSDSRAFYVYLHNVMASPARMPRHFLRSVISQLVSGRESYKDSPLYQLLMGVFRELRRSGRLGANDRRVAQNSARNALRSMRRELSLREDALNNAVFDVLFTYFAKVNVNAEINGVNEEHVNAILDWLSGDGINAELAEKIGIPENQRNTDEDGLIRLKDNQQIEQVLLVLAALARVCNRTLLICLDQFDNLAVDQVKEISRFLHALLTNGNNIMVILSGVSETMEHFISDEIITKAQQAVLTRHEVGLHYITADQAEAILRERLAPLHKKLSRIPSLESKIEQNAIFPIGDKEFQHRFGEALDIHPRSVVKWADEVWRREKKQFRKLGGDEWLSTWGGVTPPKPDPNPSPVEPIIDDAVKRALNENIADRRNQPGSLPADEDNLATLVQRVLAYCRDNPNYSLRNIERMPQDRPFHLLIHETSQQTGQPIRTGITFITSRDARSARHPLQRLAEAKDLDHSILVTDEERAPLPSSPTIKTSLEKLQSYGANGFQHLKLDFQLCVELDSLRSVIEDAANISIEHPEGQDRGLTSSEVAESLHRQKLILQHPLLHELLTETEDEPEPVETPIPESILKTIIFGKLGFKIYVTSNDVVTEVLNQIDGPSPSFETTLQAVENYARKLANDNEVLVRDHVHGLMIMQPSRSA